MLPIRDENKSGSFPLVTLLIILACGAVFLFEATLDRAGLLAFFERFALVPARVGYEIDSGGGWADAAPPFFTSMFLHGGWLHLIGNMWFLWIFGDNVEDLLGSFRFIFFYFLTGLGAGLTHYLLDPGSMLPTVGASGAIAGVLAGYVVLFPGARILTAVPLGFFVRFMHLPALVVIGLWFLIQVLSGAMTLGAKTGGIAFSAHVGGFVAGLLLIGLFRPRRVQV